MISAESRKRRKAVLASTIGAALEWYDFTLYGLASALVFSHIMFPASEGSTGLLLSLATFGVGFFARPIGGFVFGSLGDRVGRRKVLVVTLILMSASTFLIGLIPTYDKIGILAPICLVVLRIAQGFGAGAEYAGATLLASEYSTNERRGIISSLPAMGSPIGVILASAIMTPFAAMGTSQFLGWGWRVPFLLSAILFGVGLYMRTHVEESPVFQAERSRIAGNPASVVAAWSAVRHHPKSFLVAFLVNIGPNVTSYLPAVFGIAYLTDFVGVPGTVGTVTQMVANACALVVLPLAGFFSDKIGRRPIYLLGIVILLAMSFPFFSLLDTASTPLIWLAYVIVFSVAGHCLLGTQASILPALFPTDVRYSGVAFSRELASALIGGTLPFLGTLAVAVFGGTVGVSVLVIVFAILAGVGALLAPETRGKSLIGDTSNSGSSVRN